jgi:Na+-driven multidrug efflux pump
MMAGWVFVVLSYGLVIGFVLAWAVAFAAVAYTVAYVMLMALLWLYEERPIRRLLIPWVSRLINTRRSDQQRA